MIVLIVSIMEPILVTFLSGRYPIWEVLLPVFCRSVKSPVRLRPATQAPTLPRTGIARTSPGSSRMACIQAPPQAFLVILLRNPKSAINSPCAPAFKPILLRVQMREIIGVLKAEMK